MVTPPMPTPSPRTAPFRLSMVALAGLLAASMPMTAAAARPAPSGPGTVFFSDITWTVKDHNRKIGPGPNFFSASNVSVDSDGRLHLRIAQNGRKWTTAEVIARGSFGYGTYTWTLAPVPELDPNVVLGLFTWNDAPDYAHREIDVELARWGNAADPTNAQYVVQPWDAPGHDHRWTLAPGLGSTVHSFTWRPGRVDFLSTTAAGEVLNAWSYVGADVPLPGGENPRMNLWLFRGAAPSDGQPVEIVIESFAHAPLPGG